MDMYVHVMKWYTHILLQCSVFIMYVPKVLYMYIHVTILLSLILIKLETTLHFMSM